jgi:uncharacterized membrane protein YfcA
MFTASLIAICFSLGFFVESIIGFGGALVAYSILAFFIDFKTMILAGLYVGTISSAKIIYTDYKSFDKKTFLATLPLCLLGTIFGVFIFSKLPVESLSLIFGILLILLSIKIIIFDKYVFPKFFKSKLIFIGGIAQGAFGTGGPFFANALQKDFKNKSNLRTTLAALFVAFNVVRIAQLGFHGDLKAEFFLEIWWVIIPIFFAIRLGHKMHLKISEDNFKKGIAIMTIFAGIKFLSKAFY